jgi:2-phospho-L-lactate/phosphoenolpyruvate guanylyltransferase
VATHVLVPVKRLQGAKSRLAASYEPDVRRALALRLSAGVIAAARAASGIDRVWVVTSDPEVAELGAPLLDDGGLAWNEGLAHAIALLDPLPDVVAIVAGDLPLVTTADVVALVAAIPQHGVAIARAHDAGSNGLGLRPPQALVPNFGLPGSAAIHAERALAAGLDAVMVDRPGLAQDVDTPEDADRVRGLLPPGAVRDLLDHRIPAGAARPTEAPCR